MTVSRLFCYVDESGLDARSRLLVVAVIIAGEERDLLRQVCERVEIESGKGRVKWSWAAPEKRLAYVGSMLTEPILRGKAWYETHPLPKHYLNLTVHTIARALESTGAQEYRATVLIDGLPAAQEHVVGRQLHRMGVRTRKVRGIRDEGDALIRLADALCGLVRGATEGNKEMSRVLERGLKIGAFRKVAPEKQSPGGFPEASQNHRG